MSDAHNQWNNDNPHERDPYSQQPYGQSPYPSDGETAGNQQPNGNQQAYENGQPYGNQQNYGNQAPYNAQRPYDAGQSNGYNPQQPNQPGQSYQAGPQYPPSQPNPGFPGNPPYYQQANLFPPAPMQPWNVMSIVGFAFAFFIPPVGLIISIVALVQIHRSHERGQSLAVSGAVLGGILSVLSVMFIAMIIWGLVAVGSQSIYSYESPSCSGYSCSTDNSGDDSLDSGYFTPVTSQSLLANSVKA